MKPNKQCMKDILLFIDTNTKINVDDSDFRNIYMKASNIATIINQMLQEGKYTAEDLAYNIYMCYRYHLIEANVIIKNGEIQSTTSDVYGLSFEGVDFINQDYHS